LTAAGVWRSEATVFSSGHVEFFFEQQPDQTGVEALASIMLAVSVVYWLVSWTWRGSPGQRMLSLQLGDAVTGGPLYPGRLFVRWLCIGLPLWAQCLALELGSNTTPIVILVGLWQLLLLSTTANNRAHQGFHDEWAGTLVVEPA
jgi:hypothetical protein